MYCKIEGEVEARHRVQLPQQSFINIGAWSHKVPHCLSMLSAFAPLLRALSTFYTTAAAKTRAYPPPPRYLKLAKARVTCVCAPRHALSLRSSRDDFGGGNACRRAQR